MKVDGRVEPEFADAEEENMYEFLSLELESSLNLERMRHYEVVYLIHEDHVEDVDSVVLKVQDFIREKKGRIYRLNNWGLRRLAYKIKKAKKANYILMNFELEAKCINEFKNLLDRGEIHTLKAGMDSDEEEEEDDDEFEMNADGQNIILVGHDEDEMVDDDVRSTRSSEFEKMATR